MMPASLEKNSTCRSWKPGRSAVLDRVAAAMQETSFRVEAK